MSKHINLSGLKTLLEPLVHLINKKAERPDWNENDSSSSSYIANRTHYEEVCCIPGILDEITISIDQIIIISNGNGKSWRPVYHWYNQGYGSPISERIGNKKYTWGLVDGNTYTIVINGVNYNLIAKSGNFKGTEGVYVGDNINGNEDSFGFSIWCTPENSDMIFFVDYNGDGATHYEANIEIYGEISTSIIHKIDEKYLPNLVGKKGTGEGAEVFNDYENNVASGDYAHAEGTYISTRNGMILSTASGAASHSEGRGCVASGGASHAEGFHTIASGDSSHAEGGESKATGDNSHAEGSVTIASGSGSHAEGYKSQAIGSCAHAEGENTVANGDYQHVQGKYNVPDSENIYAHIVGNGTNTGNEQNIHTLDWDGNAWFKGDVLVGGSFGTGTYGCIGSKKLATEDYVDEKIETIEIPVDSVNGQTGEVVLTANDIGAMSATNPTGTGSLSVNRLARTNIGSNSCAIGNSTRAQGNSSCAMGYYTQADGDYSFAMGRQAYARGKSSVAFGDNNIAIGNYSYTEGCGLTSGLSLTGEANTKVYTYSESPFVESRITEGLFVLYKNSHAQIIQLDKDNRVITLTASLSSEALNATTVTILLGGASIGTSSHVEGECTTAGGNYSHSEGECTIAGSKGQHVQGRYNITDTSNTHAHIVGNGSLNKRSNAHTLDWQGNAWYSGDVYVGSTSGTNKDEGSKKLATEEFVSATLDELRQEILGGEW